jgi:1-acyl-sn-glycerol-3-phosphate acyltransferase
MDEADRPAETASRVVPLRGRVGRGRVPPLLSPGEIARRLAALERQVEHALAGEPPRRGALLERAIDGALGSYAELRAWLERQSGGLATGLVGELSLAALRRWWWRIDVVGRERLAAGPAIVIANRGPTLLPYDALMTGAAFGESGLRLHPLVDDWLMALPLVGAALGGLGARALTAARLRRLVVVGEAALVFPEGRDAVAHPYRDAYRVGRLVRDNVFRVAIETGTPIVPVGIIGVEEVHPVLARLPGLGGVLGIPALPLTPALLPLPAKWILHVGEPIDVATRVAARDARRAAAVRELAAQARERLQGVVSDGLRRRRAIFAG